MKSESGSARTGVEALKQKWNAHIQAAAPDPQFKIAAKKKAASNQAEPGKLPESAYENFGGKTGRK
eukprot:CAMPEP_0169405214 /NCGR_PEP_ID=MMETSP1017-20121227/56812_1 /TAXON_ID=342587 /ORGANISM="Karlodinium micrum, Strain CCMP2283" /LENGTH=65 /DNA_ID=CAMNT_0009511765 /DNA_START=280 /DNA_END=474 /DNA_ORIENTATION=-